MKNTSKHSSVPSPKLATELPTKEKFIDKLLSANEQFIKALLSAYGINTP